MCSSAPARQAISPAESDQIATFLAGGWTFLSPQAGWRAYVEAESLLLLYDGAGWIDCGLSLRQLQNLALLGIGATADGANPLLAKLNATLFTATSVGEGGSGDLRFALNKESAANTLSQLYESNYSARAETGLIGDDNFHVKVSPDGFDMEGSDRHRQRHRRSRLSKRRPGERSSVYGHGFLYADARNALC